MTSSGHSDSADVGLRPAREGLERALAGFALAAALVVFWAFTTASNAAEAPSYIVLLFGATVAVRTAVVSRDPLNPLSVIVGLATLRFGLPALQLLNPRFISPVDTAAGEFNLSRDELLAGLELAAFGVLGTVAGWYMCPQSLIASCERGHLALRRWFKPGISVITSSWVAFAAGIAATLAYLTISFGDPFAAALSGVARGGSAPGSSAYGFGAVGLLLTSALVLVVARARDRDRSAVAILGPALAATAVMTVFGGRVIALTPMALGAIALFYLRRWGSPAIERPRRRTIKIGVVAAVVALLVGYIAFVPQYRGGGGVTAISSVFSQGTLRQYGEFSLWTEFGSLHQYALAVRLGEGTLDGGTYPEMLGLAGHFLGFEGDRPGNVLVERLGPGDYQSTWGFQTGLVVDVFLNSGLFAAVLAAVAFGILIRGEYEGFRRAGPSEASVFVHCLILWTAIWVFFESVVVLPSQLQVALPIVVVILVVSKLLRRRRFARSASRPV